MLFAHTKPLTSTRRNQMTHSSNQTTTLPILDLRLLEAADTKAAFLQNLQDLARNTGFFYLIGHGISAARIQEIENLSRQFFAQDQASKDALSMTNSPHFRGYSRVNEEHTRNQPDFREQIDIGADLEAVEFDANTPLWLKLQGPNQWPENWPEFKTIVTAWQTDLRRIAITLLRSFTLALGLPEDALDQFVTGKPNELLKLIHYPSADLNKGLDQGVGAHKDAGILTLLLQDQVGGLQVLSKQDGWIEAPYVEGAFIVNIGEILELATNGYLVANMHQVVSPKAHVDRYSIAYFITPNLYAGEVPILQLPETLQQLATGPQSDPLNPLLKNAGENTIKGRLRSHLKVTEKFYPEEYQRILKQRQQQEVTA